MVLAVIQRYYPCDPGLMIIGIFVVNAHSIGLKPAWQLASTNGGSCGVDGMSVDDADNRCKSWVSVHT